MRTIDAGVLGARIEELCLEVSTSLPRDVIEALERFRALEESPAGRSVIDLVLENARVASELGVPLCQDTGSFTIYLSLPSGAVVSGDLRAEATRAVARATSRGALRPSMVADPAGDRVNTGDNTPPLLEVELGAPTEGSLGVLAKGGGSEMASRTAMLPPGAGWRGAMEFALETVDLLGARACPPLVVGLGMGGGFDTAASLAKAALMSPLDRGNQDAALAAREEELVEAINELGIGPGAVGGTVTCFGARVREAPCHMATFPVAVCLNCHALRRKTVLIGE